VGQAAHLKTAVVVELGEFFRQARLLFQLELRWRYLLGQVALR
jgi:hypothetical protein